MCGRVLRQRTGTRKVRALTQKLDAAGTDTVHLEELRSNSESSGTIALAGIQAFSRSGAESNFASDALSIQWTITNAAGQLPDPAALTEAAERLRAEVAFDSSTLEAAGPSTSACRWGCITPAIEAAQHFAGGT